MWLMLDRFIVQLAQVMLDSFSSQKLRHIGGWGAEKTHCKGACSLQPSSSHTWFCESMCNYISSDAGIAAVHFAMLQLTNVCEVSKRLSVVTFAS